MRKIRGRFGAVAGITVFIGMTLAAIPLSGQTFISLGSLNGHGMSPNAGLVQATDGNFYGTTYFGGYYGTCGQYGCGIVFKITAGGTLTTLYNFNLGVDGFYPNAALLQGSDGNLYGTTVGGGTGGGGTVFRMTLAGTLTTLYNFCSIGNCKDGETPLAGLLQGPDGNLYGTTSYGGANYNSCYMSFGCGTAFKLTLSGTLTTLHSFSGSDGANPYAGLVWMNGSLYGTTLNGGASPSLGSGTVFKVTPEGAFTMLYSFCSQTGCTDGANPYATLVRAADGSLYGTTTQGGVYTWYGTLFKIVPSGTVTTHSFTGVAACGIFGALIQATDGNFYGTASACGADGVGTIFEITSRGVVTALHSFDSTDGAYPRGALIQDSNGSFYGTTQQGGSNACIGGCGTVFSLDVGLGPFVKTLPDTAKVGASVGILGTSLTGATSVTFNGTSASFKVVSSSLITTTVPAGATTGPVQVTTPSGVLTSNVNFRVE